MSEEGLIKGRYQDEEQQRHHFRQSTRSPVPTVPLPPTPAFHSTTTSTSRRLPNLNQVVEPKSHSFELPPPLLPRDEEVPFLGSIQSSNEALRRSSYSPTQPPTSESYSSLASNSTSSSSAFGLNSPFPRPLQMKPTTQQPLNSQPRRKENSSFVYSNYNVSSSSKGGSSDATTHIRVAAKPSSIGFPFRDSMALSDLPFHTRGGGGGKKSKEVIEEEGSDESGDVDLDLSFDFQPASKARDGLGYRMPSVLNQRQHVEKQGDWVEIDIPPRSFSSLSSSEEEVERDHGISEGEMVRSPSGQLLGTKKRVKSAVELRKAYLAGEQQVYPDVGTETKAFAVMFDGGVEDRYSDIEGRHPGGTARNEWVRKTSIDPSLRLASNSLAGASSYHNSFGKGFAYNPTDPLHIPLPDSPASPDAMQEAARAKTFPLPLKLVDRLRSPSPLVNSPAWSIGSFFITHKEGPDAITANILDDYGGVRKSEDYNPDGPRSRRPSWAGELTKSTLEYMRMKGRLDTPLSDDDSPVFGGSTPSDFGFSSDDQARTPREDIYVYRNGAYMHPGSDDGSPRVEEQPVQVHLGRRRSELNKHELDGLGLDFSGDDIEPIPTNKLHPLPLSSLYVPRRRGVIPRLSFSPPALSIIEDTDDRSSVQTSESGIDTSVASPTRRLSRMTSRHSISYRRHSTSSLSQIQQGINPPPRPHFAPALRALHTSSSRSVSSPSPTDRPRSTFTPVPLTLVEHHRIRTGNAHGNNVSNRHDNSLGLACSFTTNSKISLTSITDFFSHSPLPTLDAIVPAQLLFWSGFLFGPWCWIIGGWWLRHLDGELWRTRGSRCRSPRCACGNMVGWHSEAMVRHHCGIGVAERDKWGGLDQWVFVNRVASMGAGVTISVLVGVAISAAVGAL